MIFFKYKIFIYAVLKKRGVRKSYVILRGGLSFAYFILQGGGEKMPPPAAKVVPIGEKVDEGARKKLLEPWLYSLIGKSFT